MNRIHTLLNARASLSFRIIAGVLLLLLLATTIQIYLSNQLVRHSVLAELQAQLEAKADSSAKELHYRIDRLYRDVIFLSQTPSAQGIVRASNNNGFDALEQQNTAFLINRLQDRLAAFLNANPEYFRARFIGVADSGREIVRVQSSAGKIEVARDDQLQQKADRDYFAATIKLKPGETYLSDFNLSQDNGKIEVPHRRTLRASTPIYANNGQLFGIIVISMDMGPVFDKLMEDNLGYITTYMFTQNGDYLIHPMQEKTFGFDLGRSFKWQQDIAATVDINSKPIYSLPQKKLTLFTHGGQALYGVQQDVSIEDSTGQERVVSFVYAAHASYISARNSGVNKIILLSAASVAWLISILLYIYIRKLITPLIQLGNIAHTIGEGDYSISLPKANLREVDQLALAFDTMLRKIIARDNEIIDSNHRLQASLNYADLVIESMPEAIIVTNSAGEIIRANRQVTALFGYTSEQLISQPIELLVPDRYRDKHRSLRTGFLKESVSRLMGEGMNLFARRQNGSEFPVEIGLNTISGIGGVNVLATIFDITSRKKNAELLLHANTRFSLAASAAGLGFWDYDLQRNTLQWDDTMYVIYGIEKSDTDEQPFSLWANAVHPDDLDASEIALQAAINGNAPFDAEFRIVKPSGAQRYIKAQAFVLRDAAGIAKQIYGVNIDITDRKNTEKHQEKLMRNLSIINDELNSFAYIASHDLKSPLRGIDQLAGWIAEDLEDKLDESTQKHLTLMQSRIKRMEKLLDDLLEYSRAGRHSGEQTLVDTRLLVQDIVELFGATQTIHINYLSPMPVFETHKVPLEVVFRNLIGNAIKHHPRTEIELYISANKHNGIFEFGVGDDGAGIALEHQQKIFAMFQTLRPRDKVEGSGIGLALVKKTVEGLGGTIRVESDGVSGCWFYFTWPAIHNLNVHEMF
ncbi:MAG TPA: PAS domain S-box protein [Cellvibrionaceae bacterium]